MVKKIKKFNKKHLGTSLDEFLANEGILEKTEAFAVKRALALQLLTILEKDEITQTELARRMQTSKAAINRLLDPKKPSITLNTLMKVAHALDRSIQISIV